MITLSYSCKCGFRTGSLGDAQDHSNKTAHHVDVKGFMTPSVDLRKITMEATEKVKLRVREAEILRLARDKGLVKT